MADVDIADPQHKGQGSREFNRNCTSLLTLAQLRNCIVLLSGEAIDDISGDKRGRRSAAAVQNARPQPGAAAAHGESAKRHERQWKASEVAGKHCVDTSDEEDDASQALLRELQREDAMPIGLMRPIGADSKAQIVALANASAVEGVARLGRRPRAASDPASEVQLA